MDLDRFLGDKITDKLIDEDSPLEDEIKAGKITTEDKQVLQKHMFSPAPGAAKLLLLCVHQQIALTYFHHWVLDIK